MFQACKFEVSRVWERRLIFVYSTAGLSMYCICTVLCCKVDSDVHFKGTGIEEDTTSTTTTEDEDKQPHSLAAMRK